MRKYRIIWAVCLMVLMVNYIFSEDYGGFYLLVAGLVVPLCSMVLTAVLCRRVQVSISVPKSCGKRERTEGRITISGTGRAFICKVKIDLTVKNRLTGEEERQALNLCLMGRKNMEAGFMLESALCGCVELCAETVVLYDLFGIWRRTLRPASSARINVLPDLFPVHLEILPGLLSDSDSVEYSGIKAGDDISEVFGIREYQDGDGIRNIHWKLTSKCDEIMVKLPSLPLENSILLLMETSGSIDGESRARVMDAMAEIYVTISQNLVQNGIAHQVAWYDHQEAVFFTFDIESDGDFDSILPRILSIVCRPEDRKGPQHYLQETGAMEKAHLVYLCPESPEDLHQISDQVRRTVILCSQQEQAPTGTDFTTVVCTPDNYRQQLRELCV